MVSGDPEFWAEKVQKEGMWSFTLGTNDRMGGNADLGYPSVLRVADSFKDEEWNVLVQDPLTVPSRVKTGEEQYQEERSDAGLIDRIKGDTTETRTRDVKEDILVKPREADIFQDGREYQDVVFVNIPYTLPDGKFADTRFSKSRGNQSSYERLDILMPQIIGGNFGEYVEEEMNSGNLNEFVSALVQEEGDNSEEVARAVLDGNGEFGPRSVNYFDLNDAYEQSKNNSRYADTPMRSLEPSDAYEDSDVDMPGSVSEIQRLNW